MNIENLQEWIDMPLGSTHDLPGFGSWLLRVPSGWVYHVHGNPVFVPEPKEEKEFIKVLPITPEEAYL